MCVEVWGSRENANEPLLSYIYVGPGGSVRAVSLAQGSLPVEPSHQPFLGFFEKKYLRNPGWPQTHLSPMALGCPGLTLQP